MFVVTLNVQILLLLVILCVNNSLLDILQPNVQTSLKPSGKTYNTTIVNTSNSGNDTKAIGRNTTFTELNKNVSTEENNKQHADREGVIDNPIKINKTIPLAQKDVIVNSTIKVNASERIHQSVVSKKGVSFEPTPKNEPISSRPNIQSTTVKFVPQKPKITESSEDELPIAGNIKTNSTTPKIDEIHEDIFPEKKSHSADYVVPIIAVILSVPLVAIIISVLYKRGADWWTHRNYKRMDFLIEGMYNN